jgi:DNA-binding CsgD family transcriptional regulator
MSRSANNSDVVMPVVSKRTRTRNTRYLLDMNVRVREVNDKMDINIQLDQLQLINLFKYLLERSLMNHFGFVGHENEIIGNTLALNEKEKFSIYSINRKNSLSEREVEILAKLSNGWSYRKLAKYFGIKVPTIKSHLQNIYPKLGVISRYEAIVEYRRLFVKVNQVSSGK